MKTAFSELNQTHTFLNGMFGNYFNSLGDDLACPTAYVALGWGLPGEPPNRSEYFADLQFASYRAAELRERKVNVFFGVAPRAKESRKAAAISHLLTIHLDVDKASRAIENRIKKEKPSALIKSGHGFHAYWFLDNPVRKKTHAHIVRDLNKKLVSRFDGDVGAADLARILRLPGTFNVKNPSKPLLVELVDFEPKARYRIDDLAGRFGYVIPELPDDSPDDKNHQRGHYLNAEDRDYVAKLLHAGLFEKGSRNKAMLLLIRYCYEWGCSKSEIVSWVTDFFRFDHNNNSKEWLSNRSGCIRQIRSAVDNWWKKAYGWTPNTFTRHLSKRDLEFIEAQQASEYERQFLADALKFILNNKRGDTVVLSARQIMRLRGANQRNYRQRLAMLELLNIFPPKKKYKKSTRLACEFTVIYVFQGHGEGQVEGEAQSSCEYISVASRIDEMINAGLTNKEITERIPGASRQMLRYRRRRLEKFEAV